MADEHLRSHHYVDLDGTGDSASMLAHRTHDHLVASCPECRAAWDQLDRLQEKYLADLHAFRPPQPPAPMDEEDLPIDGVALADQDEYLALLHRPWRRAKEQLWELDRTPPHERAAKIRAAYRQFHGRPLAQLLIRKSRSLVRTAPEDALHWIDLVFVALEWTRGPDAPSWAPALLARAAGHRANALRVLGDLPAADRAFVELRRSLAARPVADPAVVAEVTSLEASLRIAQQQYDLAEELLERAALAYRYAGEPLGLARARIKQAILLRSQGRYGRALTLLDEAAAGLAAAAEPVDVYLVLSIVTERINVLCDLGRYDEAARLLTRHADDFEASDDPHAGAGLRWLDGRVALGQGDLHRAEDAFTSARDGLLTLGRNHDAALISLYLAEVFLAQGRTAKLRRLAAQLVERFRTSRLPTETFNSLRLFAQAAAAETLTVAHLAQLRRQLALEGGRARSTPVD